MLPLSRKSIISPNSEIFWILLLQNYLAHHRTTVRLHAKCLLSNIQKDPERKVDLCASFLILHTTYHSSSQPIIINEKMSIRFLNVISFPDPQFSQINILCWPISSGLSLISYIVLLILLSSSAFKEVLLSIFEVKRNWEVMLCLFVNFSYTFFLVIYFVCILEPAPPVWECSAECRLESFFLVEMDYRETRAKLRASLLLGVVTRLI